jgi:hypothetical protein
MASGDHFHCSLDVRHCRRDARQESVEQCIYIQKKVYFQSSR